MDGQGPQPFEHYIGRLSEEFGGALPSVILREVSRLPPGFMEQIVEYRRYAEAWSALGAAKTQEARAALRQWPMGELAERIMFELKAEEIAEAETDG